ncbi:MAG TPA: hypothetical protein VHB99_17625 [Pirellulales bacterium]|nr:hypothetical protein [Pirellulales bacterium]
MKKHPRRRRARTIVLWAILTFAGSQAALELAIEFCWPGLRDEFCHQKLVQLQQRFAAAPPDAAKVVMLGTSAAYCDLQSERLERQLKQRWGREVAVYNFGIPGSSALMELVALKRLLAAGVRPDYVLIEVLSPFLSGCPPLDPVRFSPPRFSLAELPLVRRYTAHYSRVRWSDGRLAPCYAHRWEILRRVAPSFAVDDAWTQGIGPFDSAGAGRLPDAVRCEARFQQGLEMTERSYGVYRKGFRRDAPFCLILDETLELCRSEGICASLVLMPEASAVRDWYDGAIQREMLAFLDELGRRHEATVVDAHGWIDDGGFLDGIHLVESGADQFTNDLASQAFASPSVRTEMVRAPGTTLR